MLGVQQYKMEGQIRRPRPVLRCSSCQVRRVRCDRGTPCSACVKKGLSEFCKYERVKDLNHLKSDLTQVGNYRTKKFDGRVSSACDYCKSKKIRCDKKRPCESCQKRGVVCEVSDSVSSADTVSSTGSSTVSSVDASVGYNSGSESSVCTSPVSADGKCRYKGLGDYLGKNPIHSKDEVANFFKCTIKKKSSVDPAGHSPLSWNFLERNDLALVALREYSNSPNCSAAMLGEEEAPAMDTIQFSIFEATSGAERHKLMKVFESRNFTLQDYSNGERDPILLAEKIKTILPTKKAVQILLDHFFGVVFEYMGAVDELDFRSNIERILGPLGPEDIYFQKFNLKDRVDLAHLGLLLVILRFGYLSLTTARVVKNDESTQYVLNNPVSLEAISLAENCFEQFRMLCQPSLSVLQLALFIRCYQKYAPEFGDITAGHVSQFFGGLTYQMGFALYLNRDPDSLSLPLSNRQKNLRRMIWHCMSFSDVADATTFGNPPSIDDAFCDTKLPQVYDDYSAELASKAVYIHEMRDHLSNLTRKMLVLNNGVTMEDFSSSLSDLELHLYNKYGTLEQLLNGEIALSSADTVIAVKMWFSTATFLVPTYSLIIIHYASVNWDLSIFYWNKLMVLSTVSFIPSFFRIVSYGSSVINESSELILIPHILQLAHRSFLSCLSLFTRMKNQTHCLARLGNLTEEQAFRKRKLSMAIDSLEKCMKVFMCGVAKLAPRYYFAWRFQKSMIKCMEIANDDTFYEVSLHNIWGSKCRPYSIEELEDLQAIFDAAMDETEKFSSAGDDLEPSMENFLQKDVMDIPDTGLDKWWFDLSFSKGGLNFIYDY